MEFPDRVVCMVGRTHGEGFSTIDYLEQPGKLLDNCRDNLYAPISMAIICNNMNVHFTYLGTGCIFNYDEEHPCGSTNGFTEDDDPNFFGSSYSTVKGFTDRLIRLMSDSVLNLRIRMPIIAENHPRNFLTKISNYHKICSVHNSMTVLPDLLPIAYDMMKRGITGTVNLTNPGTISHDEILQMYKEKVDPTFKWENFSIEEQDKILLSKRSNNMLDTSKLESMYSIKNIKDSVADCIDCIAKSAPF